MSKFIISGGNRLAGKIKVNGSKNAAFPVIAAALLTSETCIIKNVPDISDVRDFLRILQYLGAEVGFQNHTLRLNCKNVKNKDLSSDLVGKIRGSILFAGALLGRFGNVGLYYPGGCNLGVRPIDIHLQGFRSLGATVRESKKHFRVSGRGLVGSKIVLRLTTVTGTENLILSSIFAKGATTIRLAATEPHVQELCKFLNKMGARISGIGRPTLTIRGVSRLHGAEFKLNPDEIEAVTLCVAGAVTRSELTITNINPEKLDAPFAAMERMGVNFKIGKNQIVIHPPIKPYQGTKLTTGVYPQLMTDMQPLFGVLATQAKGETNIHDWMYEGRFGYLKALEKMRANVRLFDAHQARILGPSKLFGAKIETPDIRAGAAILIAALIAKGTSVLYNAEIIDRGYERLDERLALLGAKIERKD